MTHALSRERIINTWVRNCSNNSAERIASFGWDMLIYFERAAVRNFGPDLEIEVYLLAATWARVSCNFGMEYRKLGEHWQ